MSSTQENYRLDRHAVDAEHEAQIGLVEALVSAVENPAQAPAAGELMEQLQSFCSAHFMSEELLMRLCAYPGYDDHAADHERTLEVLAAIAKILMGGEREAALAQLAEIKGFLTRHIRSRDAAFTDYYRRWSEVDGGGQVPQ